MNHKNKQFIKNWNSICDRMLEIRKNLKITQRELSHWMIHANRFHNKEIMMVRKKMESLGLWDFYSARQKSYNDGLRSEVFAKVS